MATTSGITRFKRLNTNIHPTPQSEDDALLYELRDGTRWISSAGGQSNIITAEALPEVAVIKTQAQFEALYSSGTWLDAQTVILDGSVVGETGFVRTGVGLLIPSTVKRIIGINGAKIHIDKYIYNSTGFLLGYENPIDSHMYQTEGISVGCSIQGVPAPRGFYNFSNLKNCETRRGALSTISFHFAACNKLENCHATSYNENSGFSSCKQIVNCSVNGSVAFAFSNCTDLIGCKVDIENYTGANCAYLNCNRLTSCTGVTVTTGNFVSEVFKDCDSITNCDAIATGLYHGHGFSGCTRISNSRGTGIGGLTGNGFYLCSYITTSGSGDTPSSTRTWSSCSYVDPNTCEGYN